MAQNVNKLKKRYYLKTIIGNGTIKSNNHLCEDYHTMFLWSTFSVDVGKSPDIPYVYVNHEGRVQNYKPIQVVTACSLNIYNFPFDLQNCSLTFTSWLHTSTFYILYMLLWSQSFSIAPYYYACRNAVTVFIIAVLIVIYNADCCLDVVWQKSY